MRELSTLQSLPALRGISALLVLMFHFVLCNLGYFNPTSWITYMSGVGFVGVYIFFLISGLVIPYSLYKSSYHIKSFFLFLWKRILRLEPNYWMNILVLILISYVVYFFTGEAFYSVSWKTILLNMFHLDGLVSGSWMGSVYWTLSVELQYYIWMGCFFPFLISSKKYARVIYIMLFSFISWYCKAHDVLFTYAVVFALGNLLFLYMVQLIKKEWAIALAIYLLTQIFIQNGKITAIALFISMSLILLNWKGFKWLNYLGEMSYSIYLFHMPIGMLFIDYAYKTYTDITMRIVFLVLAIAASLSISWFFYKFVELPSLQWSKKVRY